MNQKDILGITDFCGLAMSIHIFDGRYSDGYVAFLASDEEAAESIIDDMTGGDHNWMGIRFTAGVMLWYPMVFGVSPKEALDNLFKRLEDINSDKKTWYIAVQTFERLEIGARLNLSESCRKNPDQFATPLSFYGWASA